LLIDINYRYGEEYCDLYLFKLDLAEFKCSVLDKKTVNGEYHKLHTDVLNTNNFVLYLNFRHKEHLTLCRITGNKLNIGQYLMLPEFVFYPTSINLEGKLFVLRYLLLTLVLDNKVRVLANKRTERNTPKLICCELLIETTGQCDQKLCDIECGDDIEITDVNASYFK
jgi:hypothetical protein